MSIVKSIGKITAVKILNRVIGIGAFVFFARELGPGEFGIFVLFQASLGLLSMLADPAIGQAAEQRISSGGPGGRVYGTALLLKSALLVPLVAAILLFRGPLNSYIGGDVALLLIAAMVIQQLGGLPETILRAELRVGETAILMAIKQLVWAGVGAVLVLLEFGFYGLIYGLLAAVILRSLVALYKCDTEVGRPSWEQLWSIVDYAKYQVVANKVAPQVYNWADVTIIGIFLASSLVGAYEVAWRVVGVVLIFPSAIGTTIFPHVSTWSGNGDMKRISDALQRALLGAVFIAIPAFFGVLLLSREILTLLFGPQYTTAWQVLIILMGQKVLEATKSIFAQTITAMDYPRLNAIATVIGTALNVALNLVLIWQFGIVGAAVATTLSTAANMAMLGGFLHRVLSFNYPIREIGWIAVSSVMMTGTLAIIKDMIVIDSIPRLAGLVSVGVVLFLAFAFAFPPIRSEGRMILNRS